MTEPISRLGWAATATRRRLIDLAKKRPIVLDDDALFRETNRVMGPSAQALARDRYQRIVATLGPVQQP